jgi:sporulation protein YlmC with PRC-barrel domain
MATSVTFSNEDEGKRVVNASGEAVGRVIEVTGGVAHVEPDPGITETVAAKLGWGDSDEDTYRLDSDHVEAITDDEIRLAR